MDKIKTKARSVTGDVPISGIALSTIPTIGQIAKGECERLIFNCDSQVTSITRARKMDTHHEELVITGTLDAEGHNLTNAHWFLTVTADRAWTREDFIANTAFLEFEIIEA